MSKSQFSLSQQCWSSPGPDLETSFHWQQQSLMDQAVPNCSSQQETLTSLKHQHVQVHRFILDSINAQAGVAERGPAAELELAPYAHADIPRLVESVYLASSARTFLAALKAWAEAVRELERRCRCV